MTSHRHAASRSDGPHVPSVPRRAGAPAHLPTPAPDAGHAGHGGRTHPRRGSAAGADASVAPGAGQGSRQGAGPAALPRPGLVGWWLLEAAAGVLVAGAALAAHTGSALSWAFTSVAVAVAAGVLVHVTGIVRERRMLRRMTDAELAELLARTCAVEERYRDVYEPRHSH